MSKHRFMIELINKEDALGACSAQVWEGEAFADIKNFKPILTIPENPTNGDMIQAMFPKLKCVEERGDTKSYLLEPDNMLSPKLGVFNSWWDAPYNVESEEL